MNKEIVTQFQEIAGTEQVLIQEPMKNHTTFRIGGPAACFVRPQDAGQVERILHICRENEVPWFILGNGSRRARCCPRWQSRPCGKGFPALSLLPVSRAPWAAPW